MAWFNITPGVRFHEVMAGTYCLTAGQTEPKHFSFDFQIVSPGINGWVMDFTGEAKGKVYLDGFADGMDGEGSLDLRPFTKSKIRYEFTFKGNDGKTYRFDGTKTIRWLSLIKSWTTLPGKVYDAENKEVADATAYFDLKKDLLGLLASIRLFVPKAVQQKSPTLLSSHAYKIALAVVKAAIPKGKVFPGGSEKTLLRLNAFLEAAGKPGAFGYSLLLYLLEFFPIFTKGRRFTSMTETEQENYLNGMFYGGLLSRIVMRTLTATMKVSHFDDPEVYHAMGCVYDKSGKEPLPKYMEQVKRAEELEDGEVIECDAVVVGTGAGGAVVAKELADKGYAVVLLEEGEYYTRNDFTGQFFSMTRKLYRNSGGVFAFGNTLIPIPLGKLVGGSTAINTATCFRTPEWVLEEWCNGLGLKDLTPDKMAPYFEKVERTLPVETAKAEYVGAVGKVIARGCDRLGYHHFPLRRNAPDCDGQGVCNFGCPTDARRSMNVSYVPMALNRGALLITGAKAEKVLIKNGEAEGVLVKSVYSGKTFKVAGRATVLACGAFLTPVFLHKQSLCDSSGRVGKNLSIHPAVGVAALMDEEIREFASIPQGYCVDAFHREGILFLGASAPLDIGAAMLPFVGRKFMDMMEAYDRVASFGAMMEDSARGRVFRGLNGQPVIWYWVRKQDVEKFKRAVVILSKIFFAAGAKVVHPLVGKFAEFESEKDLEAFERARLRPRDFLISAFHPLGTCAMGANPKTSVVSPSSETYDVKKLFITDGSIVPTPVAVNPQITIMALSTRAAEHIARALEN